MTTFLTLGPGTGAVRRPSRPAAKPIRNKPSSGPVLAFRAVGDLADAYDAATLTVMHDDARALAERGGAGAAGWQSLADALGAACAIAEHEQRGPTGPGTIARSGTVTR